MGFLTTRHKIFIIASILVLIIFSIILSKTDKNYYKYKYLDQHFQGRVISNKYDENSHFQKIKIIDSNDLFLEDLKIIVLIKEGDSLVKQKNTTYFIVYKKDSRIIYDMHNKNLRIVK